MSVIQHQIHWLFLTVNITVVEKYSLNVCYALAFIPYLINSSMKFCNCEKQSILEICL
jgi:hypothetical protein